MVLDAESRINESDRLSKLYQEYAKFYEIPNGTDLVNITEDLLKSPLVTDKCKKFIQLSNRSIYIFVYPSDGLKIKGILSFLPIPEKHPFLVLLRGGNRIFGLFNPGNDLICTGDCTVISSVYRGGVSEGKDEFGGNDVNDVKNLIDFIPILEAKLNLKFQRKKMYMLGASRGGMQMFLALTRYPELQSRFKKVVSLSGLLDMRQNLASRKDMKKMFIEDFGLIKGNEEEWINWRDPLLMASKIDINLPILIVQGTKDNRIALIEGYHMRDKLQEQGNPVTYLEIEGGSHCLSNDPDRMTKILSWLLN